MANIYLDYAGANAKVKKAREYKAQHDQVNQEKKYIYEI